ncbi:peroxisomal targeting signal 2 receptor [Serendipita sp. 407]|nr:peroxisomal targeting signal 2 receptor [Serendipita sp. 407]
MVDPFPVEKCNNYNIKSPYGDFQRPGQPREPSSGSPTSGPTMEPTSSIHTPAFAHHGVAWSPFFENKLAIASSANYGLIGNGRLQVASLSGAYVQPKLVANIDRIFETQDALFDLAWSEIHENQMVTAGGDGSIRLWDITLNDHPIRVWKEHTREVYGVHWSNVNKILFCSASWDGSVRIWNPERPHSLKAIPAHQNCIYQALFSPHEADVIASCASDGQAKIFDLRAPTALQYPAPAMTIQAHSGEVLTLDWNKWQPYIIATGGTDRMIRVWDCRMVKNPSSTTIQPAATCTKELMGHEYAVRKVQWSNFSPDKLASASYDMSFRM